MTARQAHGPFTDEPDQNATVLQVISLSKTFPMRQADEVTALREVSLKVRRGRVTGLVGADGAGKTTLIRVAAGLLTPTAGRVEVLGLDSAADTLEIQSRVGYMPQKFGLYQDLTVSENLNLYADLQSVPMADRSSTFARLLAMTDLAGYTGRRAGALSGGMKQKLGLACALIKAPELLLLDEPTVGVDPVSRRELWRIVDRLVADRQIGVLVATAYLDEAERCTEVVVLDRGRVLAEGPPADFTRPLVGRVVQLTPPAHLRPRQLYTTLAASRQLTDVTIRSGRVRAVVAEGSTLSGLRDQFGALSNPVAPSFEDAFMSLIPHAGQVVALPEAEAQADVGEEEVVAVQKLQKSFGSFKAVNDLSFSVRRGEIFGLLGPNGAGKSTTFRMLCGLLPASAGEISVAGHDLRRSGARARSRLGYMAQQFSLYGQLSVQENLSFFGRAYGLAGRRLSERIDWAFNEFALAQWAKTPAALLPGGNKQRLAMAAAMLHQPDILFLDEPTSGVDPFARREFWLRINLFAQQGTTVVVTTHFMEEAEYCDRMLVMSRGETLALGSPDEIRSLARSETVPEPTMDDAFIALAEGLMVVPATATTDRTGG